MNIVEGTLTSESSRTQIGSCSNSANFFFFLSYRASNFQSAQQFLYFYSRDQQIYSVNVQIISIWGYASHSLPELFNFTVVAGTHPQKLHKIMDEVVSNNTFLVHHSKLRGYCQLLPHFKPSKLSQPLSTHKTHRNVT